MIKDWKILSSQKTNSLDDIIKIILKNRGLSSSKEISQFINPPHPKDLTLSDFQIDKQEVQKAITRIKEAKSKKESVVVYTDYDADGVCGGTIIWEILHKMGLQVMPYIPDRVEEGYGLSIKGIDKIIKEFDPGLIITVDHGITGSEKIDYAKKKGIDTIVIDHHVLSKSPPLKHKAHSIIHTTKLAATGVAWVFARQLHPQGIESYLDLVALATVADLVPLIGPNRSLVKFGLEKIRNTKRIGLKALIETAGIDQSRIGVHEIGHILAPRLNAMGRLFHALDSMRLLCTPDEDRAVELAQKLNRTNKERQVLTQDTVSHAHNLYLSSQNNKKLIFIAHETYNQGIIGLVAGKLVESYYRPAIVISKGEIYSKASARSINGFNIIETIRTASEFLVDSGGHPMAAGFTVKTEFIEIIQKKLEDIVEEKLTPDLLTNTLKADCILDNNFLKTEIYRGLQILEPFGMGNPPPLFITRSLKINDIRLIGRDNKHLKLFLDIDGKNIEAVGWNFGRFYPDLLKNKFVDIAFTLKENHWNGQTNLQLNIEDVKIPERQQRQ
ncbi:single-stranded-DNA-specific exonuclease RecJ [Candidatus Gottesmanbacteria bacterium RIFCSPHIGHO2_01_FULL_39_10]|uniref:Single-stranded-DNA-specific exonuclease RecJ n=1 Tax=Candidatus Gottesmanbacteria bacterium RIFCSPHIGHO2_01_FULL_39_10 TaxID=1798375 RepID=A0A1F5ZRT3_9BACT|nr:MAG: single-stranded-DNA-specific exonuclease RecJ [Candidatus Gottesmanbacteria bacterium RIFCSPHIGHO2_01_FULL_39_10]